MADAVRLFEVSPRDGLQNEAVVVSTADKIRLIEGLVAAGLRDIEVTSFVRPDLLPQLADAANVIAGLPVRPDLAFWALVPNGRGFERAAAAGFRHIGTVLSASETHNKRNVNSTVKESLAALTRIVSDAKAEGIAVRSYVSTAFGCPYEGAVDPRRVVDLAVALREAGADEIALGDTVGVGVPAQVGEIVRLLGAAGIPVEALALHLHDTLGMAVANALAGWQVGIRSFDGAVAGVGGCPYAPGASGNACTQDLVHLFEGMGVETGVDQDRLGEVGVFLEGALGRPLPGRYHQWWSGRQRRARTSRSVAT